MTERENDKERVGEITVNNRHYRWFKMCKRVWKVFLSESWITCSCKYLRRDTPTSLGMESIRKWKSIPDDKSCCNASIIYIYISKVIHLRYADTHQPRRQKKDGGQLTSGRTALIRREVWQEILEKLDLENKFLGFFVFVFVFAI